jgi:hypothetical protein
VLDPAYATDAVAPGPVTATAEVSRSDEPDGCTIDTCGSGATIALAVSATDDRAPTERLGYRVAIVGGDVPEGFWVDAAAIQANGWLYYSFNDDRAFSFQVEVRAVDLNGNAGPPTLSHDRGPGRRRRRLLEARARAGRPALGSWRWPAWPRSGAAPRVGPAPATIATSLSGPSGGLARGPRAGWARRPVAS